jgi:hypothetical protein
MGDETKGRFYNQEAYQYWSEKGKNNEQERKEREEEMDLTPKSRTEMNKNVAEKLKNYKDYEDFIKQYESHKDRTKVRTSARREGFEEFNYKYGPNYDAFAAADKEYSDKYEVFKDRYLDKRYYESKEDIEYYSKPLTSRMMIQAKLVCLFSWHLHCLFLFPLFFVFLSLNAFYMAKKTNISNLDME